MSSLAEYAVSTYEGCRLYNNNYIDRFGLKSFVNKETGRSQQWMRFRVLAQGLTVLAVALGSEFIKPTRPKNYEEVMENKVTADAAENKNWVRDQN